MSEDRSVKETSIGVEDTAELNRAPQLPLFTTRRIVQTAVVVFALLIAIYFLFPKLVGLGDSLSKLDQANPAWIAVAVLFSAASFVAYIALFKAVVGGDALCLSWKETYEINMAGLAATRLFSAGGAGGVVLTYWALRKAGMVRHEVGRRMVAFLTLQYAFYPLALILFGILLRTGVMNGKASIELTIVPAGVAGLLLLVGLLVGLIPADLVQRAGSYAEAHGGERSRSFVVKAAKLPAIAGEGFRFALRLFAHPRHGGLAVVGAAGYWATSIGVLWASFHAFGVRVPLAVVVQGFFLGMVANLFPFAPAGVGAVDAGMIGAFVLFGLPEDTVFPAILVYRMVAFWLPIPFGVVAFFQLRKTVQHWEDEGRPAARPRLPRSVL